MKDVLHCMNRIVAYCFDIYRPRGL